MVTLNVLLVRHAQSENNRIAKDIYEANPGLAYDGFLSLFYKSRHRDPRLTATGKAEAQRLSETLGPKLPKDILLFSSPLRRACETATALASVCGATVILKSNICEVGGMYESVGDDDFAKAPSLTRQELHERHPNADVSQLPEGEWWPHGHETHEQAQVRVEAVLDELRQLAKSWDSGRPEPVVIVCHGDFIRFLLGTLKPELKTSSIENTSITSLLVSSSGSIELQYVNKHDHVNAREGGPMATLIVN